MGRRNTQKYALFVSQVDPKNLGVGLYQHDIPPKMLETALDATVEKVVSLVGVDLNTASQAMLR